MVDLENMANKDFFEFVENFIADKIAISPRLVRCTYYELKVKLNLTENGLDRFLKCSKIILEELNYNVFFTGARFKFDEADRVVETNEYILLLKMINNIMDRS